MIQRSLNFKIVIFKKANSTKCYAIVCYSKLIYQISVMHLNKSLHDSIGADVPELMFTYFFCRKKVVLLHISDYMEEQSLILFISLTVFSNTQKLDSIVLPFYFTLVSFLQSFYQPLLVSKPLPHLTDFKNQNVFIFCSLLFPA